MKKILFCFPIIQYKKGLSMMNTSFCCKMKNASPSSVEQIFIISQHMKCFQNSFNMFEKVELKETHYQSQLKKKIILKE